MTKKELMIAYLLQKVKEEDWHAVWDAAIDLKCIEVVGEDDGSERNKRAGQ